MDWNACIYFGKKCHSKVLQITHNAALHWFSPKQNLKFDFTKNSVAICLISDYYWLFYCKTTAWFGSLPWTFSQFFLFAIYFTMKAGFTVSFEWIKLLLPSSVLWQCRFTVSAAILSIKCHCIITDCRNFPLRQCNRSVSWECVLSLPVSFKLPNSKQPLCFSGADPNLQSCA